MSIINTWRRQTLDIARKMLSVTGDFAHPTRDAGSFDEPEDGDIDGTDGLSVPNTHEWAAGYPTTTFIDDATGLLTSTTQGNPPIPDGMSIYDIYADRARRMGNDPLYTFRRNGEWTTRTANEFIGDVRSAAKGLLHYGLEKGDAVAFMCRTSYEWDVVDAAVMACGGVLATIYDTDSAEQIRVIVNNSDAVMLIVGSKDMRD